MRFVFLCSVLMVGGGLGFAIGKGRDFGKAIAVAALGLVLGLASLAALKVGDSAVLAAGVQAAASQTGLIGKLVEGVGFATTAGGLGIGFVVGVLLVQWDTQ